MHPNWIGLLLTAGRSSSGQSPSSAAFREWLLSFLCNCTFAWWMHWSSAFYFQGTPAEGRMAWSGMAQTNDQALHIPTWAAPQLHSVPDQTAPPLWRPLCCPHAKKTRVISHSQIPWCPSSRMYRPTSTKHTHLTVHTCDYYRTHTLSFSLLDAQAQTCCPLLRAPQALDNHSGKKVETTFFSYWYQGSNSRPCACKQALTRLS